MILKNTETYIIECGTEVKTIDGSQIFPEKGFVYFILKGFADIFLVSTKNTLADGVRYNICRIDSGNIILPIYFPEISEKIIIMGTVETQLIKIPIGNFIELYEEENHHNGIITLIENWIENLQEALGYSNLPKGTFKISDSSDHVLSPNTPFSVKKQLRWINTSDTDLYLANSKLNDQLIEAFPLSSKLHLMAKMETTIKHLSSEEQLNSQNFLSLLTKFHAIFLSQIRNCRDKSICDSINQRIKRNLQDDNLFKSSLSKLSWAASNTDDSLHISVNTDSDKIVEAFNIILKYFKLNIKAKTENQNITDIEDKIRILCTTSNVRGRKVLLKSNWWKSVFAPILCFRKNDKSPIVLLPGRKKYEVYDIRGGSKSTLTQSLLDDIEFNAFTFYKMFPNRKLNLKDILGFALENNYRDILNIIFIGLVTSLIGLVIPVATGIIFNTVIPEAEHSQLFQIALIIVACSFAITLLSVFKSIEYIRFSTKTSYCLQSALWDRVLKLSTAFYKKYTAGDLAQRSFSINIIHDMLSNVLVTSIINGIFSIVYLILLFYYNSSLAILCLLLSVIFIIVSSTTSLIILRYQKKIIKIENEIAGFVLQLISGISKIKISGAEKRVFSLWAEKFCNNRKIEFKVRKISNVALTFNSLFPYLSSMIIFAWIVFKLSNNSMQPGTYMAFNTAFIALIAAMSQMSSSVISIIPVFEKYKLLKPILEEEPEINASKIIPKQLNGRIELNNIGFKYGLKEPEILKGISLTVDEGKFVAIVGSSGCGKSTLLRLLLGFETPLSGTIYYDNYDLSTIDLFEIRRQLGVVLQNGTLIHGSIFQNISLATNITLNQAWDAAAMANIDKDIIAMPLGMHTLVPAGGQTLSGGQRQRIMIARALAKKPSILLLDEATSSLDNISQNIIKETIDKLSITRVVIAHRLSTIINADTIYFIKDGVIAQKGTYEELINSEGPFTEFAKRQTL